MTIDNRYKDSALTEAIIGCAIRVHKNLGPGFQERIYQAALEIELKNARLTFGKEVEVDVYYGEKVIGTRRMDFLVERRIPVELKAVADMTDAHFAQALNYLEATHLHIGLLINFGSHRVQTRRVTNTPRLTSK